MKKPLRRSPRVEFTSLYIPYRNLNRRLLKPIFYTLEKPKGKPYPPRRQTWARRTMFVLLALIQAGVIVLFARDRLIPLDQGRALPNRWEVLEEVWDIPILDCGRINRTASAHQFRPIMEATDETHRETWEARSLALAAAAREANTRNQLEALGLIVAANRIPNPPPLAQEVLAEIAYQPGPVRLFEFERPFGYAGDAAFSPDGQMVLMGTHDLQLYNVNTGELLRVFRHVPQEMFNGITDVDFSPDGQTALSAAQDGVVVLWDVSTGQALLTLDHEGQAVDDVAFLPDGRTALTARQDRTLSLWNLETGEIIRTFHTDQGYPYHFDLSPDGRSVLTAGQGDKVNYLDVETGKPILTFIGGFYGAVFSPNGYFAVLWLWGVPFELWDLRTGQKLQTFSGYTGQITEIRFSPNGRTLLSGSDDGTVRLWDVASGEIIHSFRGHTGWVDGIEFSPDGCTAITVDGESGILWDVHYSTNGQPVRVSESNETGGRTERVYSPDGRTALSSRGTSVILWDVDQDQPIRTFYSEQGASRLQFSADGRTAIGVSDYGTRYEWHIDTLDELLQWTLNNRAVRDLTCDERQRYMIEPLCEGELAAASTISQS